ncbi:hypothetical protein HPP92_012566 [Vanilla planifolia]|uniref:Cation/H+ exchanger domain-containing protein n=1 Tax=Vanilla planifolia TaxID=51239 RepID=A0A835R165_VANPL|nr:hypothetical protein HPP92_012566 [Vanilla planifolia]
MKFEDASMLPPALKLPNSISIEDGYVEPPRNGAVAVPKIMKLDCYAPDMIVTNGVWLGDDPFTYSLPLFLTQLLVVSFTTRLLAAILRPFRQPRVVAEILAGIILGPTVFGRLIKGYMNRFFPPRSMNLLESVANMGLLYFVFIIGLEMDISIFRRTGRKVLLLASAGLFLPFLACIFSVYALRHNFLENTHNQAFYIYLGIALSITSFPVLARLLVELKLIATETGRVTLSSAITNDVLGWVLLAIAIAFTSDNDSDLTRPFSHLVLFFASVFVVFCIFIVGPAIGLFLRRIPDGESMSDMDSGTILVGVLAAGLAADAIGIHSVFGAFTYGLVVPTGPHSTALIERVEEFVSDLLLPLFFATSGFRIDLFTIGHLGHAFAVTVVFILSGAVKIGITIFIAVYFGFPRPESISIGFLMNSRGIVELIILSVARDKDILEPETFAVLLVLSLIMTLTVKPVVTAVHKRSKKHVGYKRRTLQRMRPDADLRVLACVHSNRNVPSLISLIDFSNPTKRSPIFVYVLHLVELTGRTSAMLISHNTASTEEQPHRQGSGKVGGSQLPRTQDPSEHIVYAFETYEQHAGGVSVQHHTSISPYSTMHEDVCSLAEEFRAALIVLPFHKLQTVDGGMETTNPAIRTLNKNVLRCPPCSIGILVDRGLSRAGVNRLQAVRRVAVLYFGGADDREALAFGWRMAENPSVELIVVRFVNESEAAAGQKESKLPEDEYLSKYRIKFLGQETVVYVEKAVKDSEDTVAAIRDVEEEQHDLFVVGRGEADGSP